MEQFFDRVKDCLDIGLNEVIDKLFLGVVVDRETVKEQNTVSTVEGYLQEMQDEVFFMIHEEDDILSGDIAPECAIYLDELITKLAENVCEYMILYMEIENVKEEMAKVISSVLARQKQQ